MNLHEVAFHIAIAGLIVLVASLPILIFMKDRWMAWGTVLVAFNFLSQSVMVLKDISFPYIAMPNLVLSAYVILFGIRLIIRHKQK